MANFKSKIKEVNSLPWTSNANPEIWSLISVEEVVESHLPSLIYSKTKVKYLSMNQDKLRSRKPEKDSTEQECKMFSSIQIKTLYKKYYSKRLIGSSLMLLVLESELWEEIPI